MRIASATVPIAPLFRGMLAQDASLREGLGDAITNEISIFDARFTCRASGAA